MLKFIYGHDLLLDPNLAKSMFRDRASQFASRLKWEVRVDKYGLERDIYDTLDPLYIIVTGAHGEHLGSMRLLPTLGRTMLNDHFRNFYSGPEIRSNKIWECTRFCLKRGQDQLTSLKLLAASGRLMREFGLNELVGVFDGRMSRLYRKTGVAPELLGEGTYKGGRINVGRWPYSDTTYRFLLDASDVDPVEMELCVANSDLLQSLV